MTTKMILQQTKLVIIILLILTASAWNYVLVAQTGFEYYNVALVKYNIHDFDGALADVEKAIESDENNPLAYNLRGMIKYNLEDLNGAIADYTRSIELYSKPAGAVKIKVIDHRGNVIEPQQENRADPDLAVPYFNRGLAKDASEDPEGALDDYTKAIDNDPEMVTSYFNRGMIKQKQGDQDGACSDWKKSAELGFFQAEELLTKYCNQ